LAVCVAGGHAKPVFHSALQSGHFAGLFEAGSHAFPAGRRCRTVAQSDWLKVGIESPRGRRNTSRIAWTTFQNITRLLGLEAGASPEAVKQAYRDMVKV
jgi:hypothetical protein